MHIYTHSLFLAYFLRGNGECSLALQTASGPGCRDKELAGLRGLGFGFGA